MRKEVVWALSCILARSPEHVQQCMDLGLTQNLTEKMSRDGDMNVRKEAIWAMSNAMYKCNAEQARLMVQNQFFERSCDALETLKELKIIFVVLEGIMYALQRGKDIPMADGQNPFVIAIQQCDLYEKLQSLIDIHPDTQVCYKTEALFRDYFNSNDADAAVSEDIAAGGTDGSQPNITF